jgi:hypothetical protein
MMDIHCHIPPALDEGARDLDYSPAMAAQAAEEGIEVICATPHIRPDHALGIAVISYVGQVTFGLCADRATVPDLDWLRDGIVAGPLELAAVARAVVVAG